MSMVIVIGAGVVALAAFYFGAGLLGRSGETGAKVFIWVWLAASLLNGAAGVLRVGLPLENEIVAFIPIFGIPAGIAWAVSRKPA